MTRSILSRLSLRRAAIGGFGAVLLAGGLYGAAQALPGHAAPAVQSQPAPSQLPPRGQGQADPAQRAQRSETFMNRLAANLGTTPDALREALVKTEQELVDAAVAQGRLTAEQGQRLKERIELRGGRGALFGPGGRPGVRGPGRPGPARAGAVGFQRATILSAAEQALGLSPEELTLRLQQGRTLTQIAQELGKDPAAVQRDLQAALEARLEQAQSEGRLTAEQVANAKARLPQLVERLMNAQRGPGRPGPRSATPTPTP